MTFFLAALLVFAFVACESSSTTPPVDAAPESAAPVDAGSTDTARTTDAPGAVDAAPAVDSAADADPGCGPDGGPPVRFTTIYDGIIRARGCTSGACHDGSDPGSGAAFKGSFDMTSASAALANLVNVRGCRGVRVVPCKPGDSYLSEVVRTGDGICAGRRHSQGMLPPDEASMIDDWIRTGAR